MLFRDTMHIFGLKERVEVAGLFGMHKEVDKIAFYVDDYSGFVDKLELPTLNNKRVYENN